MNADRNALRLRNAGADDLPLLADLIRRSFRDVADHFGLTPENCPRHPSNCTEEWLRDECESGQLFYIAEWGSAVGCCALQQSAPGSPLYYFNRLAVLPAHRRCGIGSALLGHARSAARRNRAERLSAGIIAAHVELKDWYLKRGFVEGELRRFEHLPFDVLYVICGLESST